ncbi:MAG: hypothetical protein E6R03_07125 [Hyphomicrobiaceae bacterium]|nr:MAG: hypothetical protein E6R03_07125 [Hyphomicrobiaceae bacterium]
MAIEVQAPGGGVISFPDGTDAATIQQVMASNFGGPQQQGPEVSKLESAGRGALQGLTMGFSDELYGGAMGIKEALTGSGTFRQGYDKSIEEVRAANKQAQAANPWIYGLGEVAGGVAVPGGLARMGVRGALARTAGQGMGARMLAGAREGAAYGAVAGAGHGEGGIAERAPSAALGAGLGAAVGAVAPPLVDAGAAVARSVATPIRAAMQPRQVAREKVAEALMRDVGQKSSPLEAMTRISQRQAAGPEMMLADVGGENTRNLLRAAANQASAGAQKLNRTLDVRQSNQWSRIETALADTLADPKDFATSLQAIVAGREASAKPIFDAAFKMRIKPNDHLIEVMQRPTMMQLVERTARKMADEGASVQGEPPMRLLHRVKMEIDKAISEARNAMTNTSGWDTRTLTKMKHDFVKAIDNPLYNDALKRSAGAYALTNAAEDGFEQALKMPVEEIRRAIRGLATEGEREMWRLGAARALAQKIRSRNVTSDRTENVFSSPDMQMRLKEIMPDQKSYRQFQKMLVIEAKKADTRKAVQGNSTTAKQLMQSEEAGQPMRAAVATAQAATGRLEPFLSYVGRQAQRFSGLTPAVANEIIEAGMAKNRLPMSGGLMAAMEGAAMAPARRARTARGITYGTLGGFIGGQ